MRLISLVGIMTIALALEAVTHFTNQFFYIVGGTFTYAVFYDYLYYKIDKEK